MAAVFASPEPVGEALERTRCRTRAANGTPPPRWSRLRRLHVQAGAALVATAIPKAPETHWEVLWGVICDLQKERWLLDIAAPGPELDGPNGRRDLRLSTAARLHLLVPGAFRGTYGESLAVLAASLRASLEAWSAARRHLSPDSPWSPLAEHGSSPAAQERLAAIERFLEQEAARGGSTMRGRIARCFTAAVQNELAFWEAICACPGRVAAAQEPSWHELSFAAEPKS